MNTTSTFTGRTLDFWRVYKQAGYRHVVTRGGQCGVISRVTTANVFVRIDGRVAPRHPDDLDVANHIVLSRLPAV